MIYNRKNQLVIGIGLGLITFGAVLGYQPLSSYWQTWQQRNFNKRVAAQHGTPPVNRPPAIKLISGNPVRIELPSVKINVTVINGYYFPDKKSWTLTKTNAQYATITPLPNNQGGNTFIYGHNRWEVFYKLLKLKVGDQAIIYTDNGHKFVYQFRTANETSPNDTSLFNYQGPPILTLQTCTGIWYQNRDLMTFDLIEVS